MTRYEKIEIEYDGHELAALVEISPAYPSDGYAPPEPAGWDLLEVRLRSEDGLERRIRYDRSDGLERYINAAIDNWWDRGGPY